MPFIPDKDYLEKCIVFMYENNLIINNVMDKEEARALFKDVFARVFGSHHNFTGVLTGWAEHNYIAPSGKKIKFRENVVQNALLEQEDKRNKTKEKANKKKRSKPKKNLTVCNVCDVQFPSIDAYNNHVNNDVQHYFRVLYINKNKLLTSSFQDVIVEVSKGIGSKPEVLILRKDTHLPPLCITNKSQDVYKIERITPLHLPSCPIRVLAENLKKTIAPQSSLSLEIKGTFKNNNSQIFVHVFTVVNQKNNMKVNIIKEITIHINSEVFDELLPSTPYHKSETVHNAINTSNFVRTSASTVKPFEGVIPLKYYDMPTYLKRILNAGLKPYDGMTEREMFQFQRVLTLLKDAKPKQCLTKKNYHQLLELLLFIEEHQVSKDIRNYDMETQELVSLSKQNHYELKVPGLAEHRPSLMPGDSVFVKSRDAKETFQGIVRNIKENSVVLNFNKKFADVYVNRGSFSVSYDYSRSNIRAEHRSVELIDQHKAVSHFFPKHTGEKPMKNYNIVWINGKIKNNPEQQQAVRHILSQSSYPAPYLIFGPPGTGKTMTIIETIAQIWKLQPTAKILVCAPSNSVANEITCRLSEYIPPSELFRYLAVSFHLDGVPEKIRSCVNYDEDEFFHPTFHELLEYRVVITTLTNASRYINA